MIIQCFNFCKNKYLILITELRIDYDFQNLILIFFIVLKAETSQMKIDGIITISLKETAVQSFAEIDQWLKEI